MGHTHTGKLCAAHLTESHRLNCSFVDTECGDSGISVISISILGGKREN